MIVLSTFDLFKTSSDFMFMTLELVLLYPLFRWKSTAWRKLGSDLITCVRQIFLKIFPLIMKWESAGPVNIIQKDMDMRVTIIDFEGMYCPQIGG